MRTKTAAFAALIAAVALALVWFRLTTGGAPAPVPATVRAREPAPDPAAPARALEQPHPATRPARVEPSPRPSAGTRDRASTGRAPVWRGRVLDTGGQPVPGALAWLTDADGADLFPAAEPALADEQGRFAFEPPGPVEVRARPLLRVESELHYAAYVPAGGEDQEPLITLVALPRVEGILRVPAGSQLPEVTELVLVIRVGEDGEEERMEVVPGEDGRFLAVTPPGRLVGANLRAAGFLPANPELDLALARDRVSHFDLQLEPGALVRGRVVDAVSGEPLADAEVWAGEWSARSDDFSPAVETDPGGRFRLVGVDDRKDAHASAAQPAVLRVHARAPDHAEAVHEVAAELWSASRTYELELQLQPTSAAIEGVLVDADGEPVAGLMVRAVDAGRHGQATVSGRDGGFQFEQLHAGTTTLSSTNGLASEQPAFARLQLALAVGERRACRLVLASAGRAALGGRVLDASGQPAVGIRIEARLLVGELSWRVDVDRLSTRTDAEGRYTFERLPPGPYQLLAQPDQRGNRFCSRPQHHQVELGADARTDLDLVVGGCAYWGGRVFSGAVPPAVLRLELVDPSTGETVASGRPNAAGAFRLKAVGGWYELVLFHGLEELARTAVDPRGAQGLVLRR